MVLVTKFGSCEQTLAPPENFTGHVEMVSRFQRPSPARLAGVTVIFAKGARTNWHKHPLGQTLLVTEGAGWVQEEGEKAFAIAEGDSVWIPATVRHWHGASTTSGMTHVALQESLDGKTVEWLEAVDENQYPSDG